jgi:hypothetical protein
MYLPDEGGVVGVELGQGEDWADGSAGHGHT